MGASATQPRKRLGAWLARLADTVYQAATDGFVCAYRTSVDGNIVIKTDNIDPPTVIRHIDTPDTALTIDYASVGVPVKRNDYWKVEGGTVVWWIPWEL